MLTLDAIMFIGLVLEGFFFGLYFGIFVMYLQIQASKKDNNKMQNIIFYSICALYGLSVAVLICDIAGPMYRLVGKPIDSLFPIDFIQTTTFGCCDFIAQFILIYRCWIVWRCNFRVVIVPALLTFAFLGTWLASSESGYISLNEILSPHWAVFTGLTSLVLSLTVNALVTGLIVLRIFKVFLEVRATSEDQILGTTGGNKLRSVILILIESGMALFAIQVAYLVVNIVGTDTAIEAIAIIGSIYDMLTGIIPTIILVRTSMGLSFHDEKSMEEAVIGSLRFASGDSDRPNSVPETGSIDILGQDNRDDDNDVIEVQRSDDIEVVDR